MQISSRFTIAVHIFTCIAIAEKKYKVTSKFLAGSINVNPVIIRNIVLMLKAHGLIDSRQGTSGIKIAKMSVGHHLVRYFQRRGIPR